MSVESHKLKLMCFQQKKPFLDVSKKERSILVGSLIGGVFGGFVGAAIGAYAGYKVWKS